MPSSSSSQQRRSTVSEASSLTHSAHSDETAWHCKHHVVRGVMMFYEFGAALAQNMGVPVSEVEETVETYHQVSLPHT